MPASTTPAPADGIPIRRNKPARPRVGRLLLQALLAVFGLYLLLPIALLLVGAVGESWTNTLLPAGVTGHWFADLAANRSFTRAFGVSFMVALACCALNAVIGLPLAYALHHRAQAGGGFFRKREQVRKLRRGLEAAHLGGDQRLGRLQPGRP